ncbi:hypothetical protein AM493_02950 [Flavobacterium akiainvivens]|uniref:Uncharacterized protein n=1 Tax=Flavobacterium akiainvivens TaxID=1202724 RepID=A0A0M9VH24_9FLAO|nr:hypothetical protein AM493_02950 [Flavobacterium akiainvivens]SFQ51555.1 hypothetical protein SAMN05444144_106214 [Flavobacterium akiainvivens]
MGASHNRFYVEKLFYKWATTNDEELAERLSLEMMSEGKEICYKISHIEYSINVNRKDFHKKINNAIGKLCKKK